MLQERIKRIYPSVTLPTSYSEEDRGFKRCCERRLVLASISSSITFHNDVNSAWIKLADVIDTYEFQLLDHNGNPTIYVPVPAPIPSEPNAYYTTIEWRDVLLSDGVGCYTIKIVANIGGIEVDLVWGEYELKPYTIDNANGTARISCKFGLQQQLEGINFADSQVRDDLRFNGQIEKGNPNMQIDSLIYNNRRIETVVNENLQEWILRTDPYTDEILRLFTELYLLSANEIFLSDYNAHTSTYRIRDIEATVEESPEKTKSGDTTRFQSLSCVLSDRVKDVRSMYGGQGVGSGANSPSTPAPFCLASSYTVEYAGGGGVISAGTIPSGQSEAIVIPDCPITCADATVHNTDNSYTASVPSGGDLELVNEVITITDENDNVIETISFPVYENQTIELSSFCPAGGSFNDMKLLPRDLLTNYGTGDQPTRGRETDFFTLNYTNEWGHAFRFCGTSGGYTDGTSYFDVSGVATTKALAFPNDIICDFTSRNETEILTYYTGDSTTYRGYTTALPLHVSSTFGGLTAWYLWNDVEMRNVMSLGSYNSLSHWMAYKPFEFTDRYYLTSTRAGIEVFRNDFQAMAYGQSTNLTNALLQVFVRYTTLTELGL